MERAERWSFMEPSGRNRWQPVANAEGSKTAQTSQNRCHQLPKGAHGKEEVDRSPTPVADPFIAADGVNLDSG
jgi:hypothetical protein